MLQAPSHFSRVCGHGHIKKFWLMQTQKESQACESKSSVLFSSPSPSRPVSRGTVKGPESSPWSSSSPVLHSPGYTEVSTPPKHSSFTCAESLSPPSHFSKGGTSHSTHSTASTGAPAVKDSIRPCLDGVASFNRIPEHNARPSTPPPRSYPLNVASEFVCKNHRSAVTPSSEADLVESLPLDGCNSRDDTLSTSVDDSSKFHTSYLRPDRAQEEKSINRAAQNANCSHPRNEDDRSSPAHSSRDVRDVKVSSCSGRPSVPVSMGSAALLDRSRSSGAMFANRAHDHSEREYQPLTSHVQHPTLKACTVCKTTKTPMWRSGPQGPKSLCNACGIRFKKYRSCPGQSESPELMVTTHVGPMGSKSLARPLKRKQNPVLPPPCEFSRPQKMCFKAVVSDAAAQQQRKSKWHQLVVKRDHNELKELNRESINPWNTHSGPASFKKIYGCAPFQANIKKLARMEEHQNAFAKDEEEAAVLLMHLSCGLVY